MVSSSFKKKNLKSRRAKNQQQQQKKIYLWKKKTPQIPKKSRVNLLFLFAFFICAFFICPLPVLSGILPFLPYGGW